jgi:hypothetical protein
MNKELEQCRRSVITNESVRRAAVLRFKVEKLQEQIDVHWKQMAHIKWLEKGDRNTAFFHKACSES